MRNLLNKQPERLSSCLYCSCHSRTALHYISSHQQMVRQVLERLKGPWCFLANQRRFPSLYCQTLANPLLHRFWYLLKYLLPDFLLRLSEMV
jgi:hypothetical protein